MNLIQLAGRLGADPESRFTASGQKVTTLRVATNSRIGAKDGKEETVWWRVTIWGDRFDKMLPYLKKGSAIIVFGEVKKPEIYTDKEGRPQISLEVYAEMIKFNPFGSPDRPAQEQSQSGSYAPQQNQSHEQPSYGANHGGAPKFAGNVGQSPYNAAMSSEEPPF